MAKKVKKKNFRKTKKSIAPVSPFKIYWQKENYYILIIGLILIIVGFYLMSIGPWNSFPALVLSPIILIVAYVLIFPASILFKKKNQDAVTEEKKVDTSQS